ncbi:MAG TPA: class I SAM-dependent methyltransferase [bacterium]|nr:class I SAM-dependent methyltransferase [bacterium]
MDDKTYYNYLCEAPLALATERYFECLIFFKKKFQPPILDLGCGEGIFAKKIVQYKLDIGLNINISELKKAIDFKTYKLLVCAYGNAIPLEDNSINTIISNSVLEHIVDLRNVLSEANRVLKRNGKMYVTVPTDMFDKYSIMFQLFSFLKLNSFAEKYRKYFNKFWKHYHFYSVENWTKLFEKYGFEVVESKLYDSKIFCLMNDFFVPFGFFAFLNKKIFNEWIICKKTRKYLAYVFDKFFKKKIENDYKKTEFGLVYFELKKV